MTTPVVIVADGARTAGLGHISRSSALAVALGCHGVEPHCFARGALEPFERDGVHWAPLPDDEIPTATGVLVVDSYHLPAERIAAAGAALLVVMHDHGRPVQVAALVVAAAAAVSDGSDGTLGGLKYAALRPGFWGLPPRVTADEVQRVLVTTGSGPFGELGCEIAAALRDELGEARIDLLRGPGASFEVPDGVQALDAPASLLEPLLAADLVVTAAGQTMLEAAACGTPAVAVALVENQERQARRLAEYGAVLLVEPPLVDAAVAAAVALAGQRELRQELSQRAQQAVDGYGALRVAFQITRISGFDR